MNKKYSVPFLFGHLGVSYVQEPMAEKTRLDGPELAMDFWWNHIAKQDNYSNMQERVVVLCLNTRHKVQGFHVASIGSINESIADPRDILRPLILSNSHAAIIMHNHPSGESNPSETDRRMTQRMRECCQLFRINLLDHVIVGAHPLDRYFSFKEVGLL